jgi:hypothetical protein
LKQATKKAVTFADHVYCIELSSGNTNYRQGKYACAYTLFLRKIVSIGVQGKKTKQEVIVPNYYTMKA